MINLYISPDYSAAPKEADNGGIRRVCEAEIKYFPKFGINIVHRPKDAHIIQNHGGMDTFLPGIPSIHTGHGLMWSRQPWGEGYQEVNQQVIDSMIMAAAHTVPSEWVARSVRRGGFFYPEVIYHGVVADEFAPSKKHGNYCLWNKLRADYVSDPNDLVNVAARMTDVMFQTTIGRETTNVHVFGPTPYEKMKEIVSNAGVYLCTARETFGIGTLEALASGVPVAGWGYGGQSEIVIQGETGYLAPPGDYKALENCVRRCLAERDRLSINAMEDARSRWTWEPRIAQYAGIIKRVYEDFYVTERPKVSVIVTACNLDRFLPECLRSVSAQTFGDFECIVIDDCGLESTMILVGEFSKQDKRIRYLRTPENLGLPGARNFGLSKSKGRYIRHLDADDFLAPNALALEVNALDSDPHAHIVYGHLEVVREDGSRIVDAKGNVQRSGWPEDNFNWYQQMAHLNQLPSCCMARREVFERSGGYRERMKRNEDAEFWCRTTSLGFRAKKFTQAVTYFHRQRGDSKGALEWNKEGKEPDWTSWFPWRMGAGDFSEGREALRRTAGHHPAPHLVPFGAQGKPQGRKAWHIHDYSYPVVSVIVTCGPHHKKFLIDALDSVQAQTFPDWECYVVNDTGEPWAPDIMGAPYARVINMDGNQGVSAARNAGYRYARGKYIIWMDADDYWLPWMLERMVAQAEVNDGIIFSDIIQEKGDRKLETYTYPEFTPEKVALHMHYPGSSILIPRKAVEAVFSAQGGWDTQIPGMEDFDFQIAMHHAGFCAYRIPEALFVYRVWTSTKREADYAKIDDIKRYLDVKWAIYRKEGKAMGCGCGPKKIIKTKPANTMSSSGNFPQASQDISQEVIATQMVNVEYMGDMEQSFTIRSRVKPGITYLFGNNPHHKVRTVLLGDAHYLSSQIDGNNRPIYRIVTGATMEQRDPSAFLGQAVSS